MKMSRVAAALLAAACSPSLLACTACFGQSDSSMAKGMNMGIFVLLAVIMTVLLGVVSFFYYLARRGAQLEEGIASQINQLSQNTTKA